MRKLAVWIPATEETLADVPGIVEVMAEGFRRMELARRGFPAFGVRCARCHRLVRCVFVRIRWVVGASGVAPTIALPDVWLYGATCYRKAQADA